MVTSSSVDPYAYSIGMLLNNATVEAIAMSGLFTIPLIYALIESAHDACQYSNGNVGERFIKLYEKRLLEILLVLMLVFTPALGPTLHFTHVITTPGICYQGDTPSEVDGSIPQRVNATAMANQRVAETGTSVAIGGITPEVPLLVGFVHNIVSGLTNTIIKTMPCADNLHRITTEFTTIQIETPQLKDYAESFIEQCYVAAYSYLDRANLTDALKPEDYSASGYAIIEAYANNDTLRMSYNRDYINATLGPVTPPTPSRPIDASGNVDVGCLEAHRSLWDGVYADACVNEVLFDSCATGVHDDSLILWDGLATKVSGHGPSGGTATADYLRRQVLFDKIISSTIAQQKRLSVPPLTFEDAFPEPVDARHQHQSGWDNFVDAVAVAGAATVKTITNITGASAAQANKVAAPMVVSIMQGMVFFVTPLILLFTGFRVEGGLIALGIIAALEFFRIVLAFIVWIDEILMGLVIRELTVYHSASTFSKQMLISLSYLNYALLPAVYFTMVSMAGIKVGRMMSALTRSMK